MSATAGAQNLQQEHLPGAYYWPGALPSHWRVKRLKFSVRLVNDKGPYGDGNFPYMGLEHIEPSTGRYLEAEDFSVDGVVSCFSPGDVLFGKLRPYLAKIHLAQHQGVCSTEALVLRPSDEVIPSYLRYFMVAPVTIENINSSTNGSKMPRASWDFIGNQLQPLPPVPEQKAIATFLDKKTAEIDTLIAKKRKLLALLAEKRIALITRAVTKGLNPGVPMKDSGIEWLAEIPAHWDTRLPIKYLVTMSGGMTPSTSNAAYWDGDIPWVSPKDMKRLELFDSEDHVTDLSLSEIGLRLARQDCVLMVVRGMILAHSFPVAINRVPVTLNQDMKALMPCDRLASEYLAFMLISLQKHILTLVETSAHGTKALRTGRWKELLVALPPFDEQRDIVRSIRRQLSDLGALERATEKTIGALQEYRAALITNAVTGQIKVA